jgi:mRNA interferase HigB
VRAISRSTLRRFWESRTSDAQIARRDLTAWLKVAKNAVWANFASLKESFSAADQVGNCVVFDVGNNRYRLIGRVLYSHPRRQGRIYVLRVMDHKEYDKGDWIDACGCHRPPPKKPTIRQALPQRKAEPHGRKKGR